MNLTTNNGYKRFFIKTLGCKVNQYESQAMREILTGSGFKECLSKEIADIYILNTCTVTEKADKESRHFLGLFHKMNPKAAIVVTGCYAETGADKISFLPGVAHIIKNSEKSRIADILSQTKPLLPERSLAITDFKDHTKAFVKIQDGCENFCSYCKVPLVRSRLVSKPINDIVEEVGGLVLKGFKEIVLTGICLGAWRPSLTEVLKTLANVRGDFRIRLSSIEPKYVTDELIELVASNKRFCRHFHIPLQSGDDRILEKMNRPYTAAEYKALLKKINERMDDAGITTDVMLGFPGETDTNFSNTVDFIKDILPLRTHIFTFSRREDTAAYDMGPELPAEVLKKRYYKLKETAISASYLFRRKFLGQNLGVLVESKRDKSTGLLSGYSDNYIKVLFDGPDTLMKNIATVKVSDLNLTQTLGAYEPK